MKIKPHSKWIIITAILAVAYFAIVVPYELKQPHGIIREFNSFMDPLSRILGGFIWLGISIIFAIILIFNLCQKKWKHSLVIFGCGLFSLLVPPLLHDTFCQSLQLKGEVNDLKEYDLDLLREEASELLAQSKSQSWNMRWAGIEVPELELPHAIKELSKHAAYVSVLDEGVFLLMTGLGNWRGGYLITPPGQNEVPSHYSPRKIKDGFYFLIIVH